MKKRSVIIIVCTALLWIDFSLTSGALFRVSYPLASVLVVWWNLQQVPDGNTSLLLIDLAFLGLICLSAFSLSWNLGPIPALLNAIRLGSFALLPLGLVIYLNDFGEWGDRFCQLCGPITNQEVGIGSALTLLVSGLLWTRLMRSK